MKKTITLSFDEIVNILVDEAVAKAGVRVGKYTRTKWRVETDLEGRVTFTAEIEELQNVVQLRP